MVHPHLKASLLRAAIAVLATLILVLLALNLYYGFVVLRSHNEMLDDLQKQLRIQDQRIDLVKKRLDEHAATTWKQGGK